MKIAPIVRYHHGNPPFDLSYLPLAVYERCMRIHLRVGSDAVRETSHAGGTDGCHTPSQARTARDEAIRRTTGATYMLLHSTASWPRKVSERVHVAVPKKPQARV